MGIRDEIRRLKRRAEREAVVIPQKGGGPPLKFPKSALGEAFLNNMSRLAGEDVEPHPVSLAIANSPEPNRYSGTFFDIEHQVVDEDGEPVEDLSE